MVTLIADSGSTKTDWAVLDFSNGQVPAKVNVVSSQGINPIHQSDNEIKHLLLTELLPSLPPEPVNNVYFYGSGVRPEKEALMISIFRDILPCADKVEAHSDLLGAARALCGHDYGIACILGTGANSCLFDGNNILKHTPALGYVLGDEGSGAVLGKRFLHDLYSGILPNHIKDCFADEMKLTLSDVIDRVYRQSLPNRFLASLSKFIVRHVDNPLVKQIVVNNFRDFIKLHISPYGRMDLPLSFVGSIAFYFQVQLSDAIEAEGYRLGTIMKSPVEGLVRYHS